MTEISPTARCGLVFQLKQSVGPAFIEQREAELAARYPPPATLLPPAPRSLQSEEAARMTAASSPPGGRNSVGVIASLSRVVTLYSVAIPTATC